MAILSDNPILVPRVIAKDLKLKRTANEIKEISGETFKKLVHTQRRGVDLVWNNPDATAQEVIDELGSDAIKVFQFHGALTEYIIGIASADGVTVELKYPTNKFIIDKGGVITVTEEPYFDVPS